MRLPEGVEWHAPHCDGDHEMVDAEALSLMAALHRTFDRDRRAAMHERRARTRRFDMGERPDFSYAGRAIRSGDWRVAPLPAGLTDRRVELATPATSDGLAMALDARPNAIIADFEDALSPLWRNLIAGQAALKAYWSGGLDAAPGPSPAIIVRPRGLHLFEEHIRIDGQPVAAAFFDVALTLRHGLEGMRAAKASPHFYLPKLESDSEARLWNSVFAALETSLGLAPATIKASILIETLPAAFAMDEILYVLKDRAVALACGRWDYVFSFIKKLSRNPAFLMPDRTQIDFSAGFLRAFALLLVKTCHRRGALAIMGGMAGDVPSENEASGSAAIAKVTARKESHAADGFDGSWVAHPSLVDAARAVFARCVPNGNQLDRLLADVSVKPADLLAIGPPIATEAGLRQNIRVGVRYIEAWLRGIGAAPLYGLIEDASTAEISRAQVWQQIQLEACLNDGRIINLALFLDCLRDEMRLIRDEMGHAAYDAGCFPDAIRLFRELTMAPEFESYFTIAAYRRLLAREL